jgi:hypothetical protein
LLVPKAIYKKPFNRYLIGKRRKALTICIAIICQKSGRDTKIVLCADREVTSVVEFQNGSPKIKKITDYCYGMHSSNDSLISDALLEKVSARAIRQGTTSIYEIADFLKQECVERKKEQIEKDVLFAYNLTTKNLTEVPEPLLRKAVGEVSKYQYQLEYDFILAGLEPDGNAHIYWVNQDGNLRCYDSLGHCSIGSGGLVAFIDLTKVVWECNKLYTVAVPLVYFAKKVSESATGVGSYTDLWLLHYPKPDDTNTKPEIYDVLAKQGVKELLNDTYDAMVKSRLDQINATSKKYHELMTMTEKPLA